MNVEDDFVEIDVGALFPRRHSSTGEFTHHGPVVTVPPTEHGGVANVAAHELSHFWIHASTPYGLVLDELANLQQRNALWYCHSLDRAGSSIPVPAVALKPILKPPLSTAVQENVRSAFRSYVIPWSQHVFLEQWLEGEDVSAVTEVPLGKTLRWLVAFEERGRTEIPDDARFAGRVSEFSDYQRNFVRYWADYADEIEAPSHPTIGTGMKTKPFGARHIFEALAQQGERPDDSFWDQADSTTRELYWGLLAHVYTSRGESLSEEEFLSAFATFTALAELSLFTPIGAVYGRLREDQMTWLDIHPGWRMIQLIERLQPEAWLPPDGEGGAQLQRMLSRPLGWPDPDDFLEVGASLAADDAGRARHAAACRCRLEHDERRIGVVIGDASELQEFFNIHGPILIRGNRTAVIGEGIPEKTTRLVTYALASLSLMTMASDHVDQRKLVPPGLDPSLVLDPPGTVDQLLGVYRESFPFLARDAFRPAAEFLEAAPSGG
jgi:hypothetical protein